MATGSCLKTVAAQRGANVGGRPVSMAAQLAVTRPTYAVPASTLVSGKASGIGSASLPHLHQVCHEMKCPSTASMIFVITLIN